MTTTITRRALRRSAIAVAAGTLLVIGCSSDDSSSDAQAEVVEALAAQGDEGLTDDQLSCFADELVEQLGEDEALAFAADPDAWTGEQVDEAISEGLDGGTPAMDGLGVAFEVCGIEVDAGVVEPDLGEPE